MNTVVYDQIRDGHIDWVRDGAAGIVERTLYLSGTPPVVLRELGGRELIEVPRSEVSALIEHLGLANDAGEHVSRAILEAYQLSRLGSRAAEFLDACQAYHHTPRNRAP